MDPPKESLKRACESPLEAQPFKRARDENESLKRAEPPEEEEPRPLKRRCVQIPRTLAGEVEDGFVYPTRDNQGEAHDALVRKFPAWQKKHAARAKKAKAEYMFSNPARKKGFKKALAAWRKEEQRNGGIVFLEMSSESGGFDGDKHYGSLDGPMWGLYRGLLRWQHGHGWHHLHYPSHYLEEIVDFIETSDAAYSAEGYGPAIYITKALDKYDGVFTAKEKMELEFAVELQRLLDDMYEDCLEHELLTMSCEDTILFASALSRLPKRADQEWEDEPPTFVL